VDPIALDIPTYFEIIKHPMDLGTVRSKLISGSYKDINAFAADVRLTFDNAMLFNPVGHWVHEMAKNLKSFFESNFQEHLSRTGKKQS
ncbi:hypothetical protein GUITHDRAFT_75230, partial [Guillardia theta CCMP2712]